MAIMPAAMHSAHMPRHVGEAVLFDHIERIHVGAQSNGGITVSLPQHPDHASSRHCLMNLLRSPMPEPWVDRRGRCKGNLLALADLLRGRIHPTRVVAL